jgi:tetratricopeptide (TPR) repeat protein
MDKLWSKTETAHLKRYADQQSLEELAQRFHTDTETVRRKMQELGLAAGSQEPEQVDETLIQLEEALRALHAHRWQEAEGLFQKLIDTADHQHLTERSRQYLTICRNRLNKVQPSEDAYLQAVFLKNQGKFDEALELVKRQGKAADDERWTFLAGSLHALGGRDDEALALIAKSIELNPHNRVQAYHDPDLSSLRGRDGFTSLLRARS